MAKELILLDPSATITVSYSTICGSLADGRVFQNLVNPVNLMPSNTTGSPVWKEKHHYN